MTDDRQLVSIDELLERLRDDSATGGRDRATVALVDAKVDGLKELMRAEFANIKEQVAAIGSVVSDVIKLGVQSHDHESRIKALEASKRADHDFKRFNRPTLIIASVTGIAAILTAITQFH